MGCQKLVLLIIIAIGFSASVVAQESMPIDEMPMYGGLDRSAIPELQAIDEKLIESVKNHYGTRQKAAVGFVNNGFAYYQQNDFVNAMHSFNQAWILDPKNPELYAGFAALLHDQGKNCEAMQMMERALDYNPPAFQGIYSDAARIFTLCAISDSTLSRRAKKKILDHSEALYTKAEKVEANKAYVYGSWATAYYWRGQYKNAWAMVAKERLSDGSPSEKFLDMLRQKLPEPQPR